MQNRVGQSPPVTGAMLGSTMALLWLLPSAMKLVLPSHPLEGLLGQTEGEGAKPSGLLSLSAECTCLRSRQQRGVVASAKSEPGLSWAALQRDSTSVCAGSTLTLESKEKHVSWA